jgi:glyoxylase-like metal-dependent hydrolase (beta-lactamase superfamily II)
MKKLLLLSILALSTLTQAWFVGSPSNFGNYKFDPLNEKVYVMHGPLDEPNMQNYGFMNNPAIVIGDTGLIVIDPGSTYFVGKKVLEEIEKITTKPVLAVFNTHVHGDHWLGNQAIIERYPHAKIYAHPNMIARAKASEGENWINVMNNLTQGLSAGTIATYPTDATQHLQEITIAGETFKIHNDISAVAHTNTDIMIEHVDSKTLFLGDNDFVNRMGRFDATSNMHGNIKTLAYAIMLGLDYYVPGHGLSGDANEAVRPFLDYLLTVQSVVKKGYAQDLADYEIKPFADRKLAAYHHWSGYEAQLGKHINKMLMEIEELDL